MAAIIISMIVAAVSTGCGASGASIFMKDGSIVNIGDTNPQVQTDDSADTASAGESGSMPSYTYEGAYDPSTDPYITGGDISPFYNIGSQTAGDTAVPDGAGTDPNAAAPANGSATPSDTGAPRDASIMGGTAAEIISNAAGHRCRQP